MDQLGGALALRLPEDARDFFSKGTIVLYHNGGCASVADLDAWLRMNGLQLQPGREIEVPRMEPGEYAVCSAPRTVLASGLGAGPGRTGCVRGVLSPLGRLTLSVTQAPAD